MDRLSGKVAIITGAASGQGAEEAKLFVAEGAKVVMTDVQQEAGEQLAAELGPHAVFVKHDVTNEADWAAVVAAAVEHFGGVDVLVNNAGILAMPSIEDTTPELFDKIMAVNVRGAFLGIKAVLPLMKSKGAGSIINISSAAGMSGQINALAYTSSKWALRGMTKSAALDLGLFGIRVNSIHPGTIATPMTAASGVALGRPLPLAALNRAADPAEVATGVLFLASDESSYMTGSEMVIDGGMGCGHTPQIYGMMAALAQMQR